jgi:hypothetical protein
MKTTVVLLATMAVLTVAFEEPAYNKAAYFAAAEASPPTGSDVPESVLRSVAAVAPTVPAAAPTVPAAAPIVPAAPAVPAAPTVPAAAPTVAVAPTVPAAVHSIQPSVRSAPLYQPLVYPATAYKAPAYNTPAYKAPAYSAPAYHAPTAYAAPAYYKSSPYSAPAYAYDEPASYAYNYGVADGYSGAYYNAGEQRDGYSTAGSYSVALPDGRVRTVNYHVADAYSGYVADVQYANEPRYQS